MFVRDLTGILMKIEEDSTTRYRYELWFDYTRKAINTILEGAMLAVPNFGGNDHETHYSILEVTGILPMHYALGSDVTGYPGFVVEAARNAGQDWVTQDQVSTEDTTKIKCIAIPTNLEIVEKSFSHDGAKPIIKEESNLPMVGHEAHLLDTVMTEKVANLSLDLEHENVIQIGTLVRDENVRAYLRVEDLIKVHFGIFGFTGAGKSNLVSTLVRELLTESTEPIKVMIFDLMSEYTGLLIDLLTTVPALIINLGVQTVPESLLDYHENPTKSTLQVAAEQYLQSTLLPKGIKRSQKELLGPMIKLIQRGGIRIYQPRQKFIGELVEEAKVEVLKGNLGNAVQPLRKFLQEMISKYSQSIADNVGITQALSDIENFEQTTTGLPKTALTNLDNLRDLLKATESSGSRIIPARVQATIPQIIKALNDSKGNTLLLFQAHDPNMLREFAAMLTNIAYEARRKTGQITPLVSFIFDEADEFIPGQPSSDSQKEAKAAVMTLARRGRKFGLGIGIATQRIRYLDTSILAQPHTYFVSKLPRQSDRQAIAEAFGISEDMFRQTFKFKKGDWLLASYDAAGLEAIPIPIHAENADDKILEFVQKYNSSSANLAQSLFPGMENTKDI